MLDGSWPGYAAPWDQKRPRCVVCAELDARSNFEPIMQSVRDLNKLDDA
jgi:hypothetical protein